MLDNQLDASGLCPLLSSDLLGFLSLSNLRVVLALIWIYIDRVIVVDVCGSYSLHTLCQPEVCCWVYSYALL